MALGRKITSGIGAASTVVSNTVPVGLAHIIHGLSLANVTAGTVLATVTVTDGTIISNVVKNIPIPAGDSLGVMGMDFKHNIIPGDSISVASDTAASIDAICSYVEA